MEVNRKTRKGENHEPSHESDGSTYNLGLCHLNIQAEDSTPNIVGQNDRQKGQEHA